MRGCVIGTLLCFGNLVAAGDELTGKAAELYRQSLADGRFGREFAARPAEVKPTADGRSFWVISAAEERPTQWIVSVHGAGKPARGFAVDDLAVWRPHLKDRRIGLLCLQWWLGTGDKASDFYSPREIYREIEARLQAEKI